MTDLAWVGVDWGMSNLRAWLLDGSGTLLDQRRATAGAGTLQSDGFEPALLDLIGDALPAGRATPVLICGAAGAREGWAEVPYVAVPCTPPTIARARLVSTADPRLRVAILPGVMQSHPADVMRGEETQIAGYLSFNPGFDGVICLPGTHCKWAHVSAGEIVSFRSFLTGELFAQLCQSPALRNIVAPTGWDDAGFDAALDSGLSRPANFAADLVTLRAEALLHGLSPETARARLSGLLIGIEIAAAKPYWLGREVALIGDAALTAPYRRALDAQAVPVILADADRLTLQGLKAAKATQP